MTDKFAPPIELWDAAKCARVLGYKNVDEWWRCAVRNGRFPQPVAWHGMQALWNADEVRQAARKGG